MAFLDRGDQAVRKRGPGFLPGSLFLFASLAWLSTLQYAPNAQAQGTADNIIYSRQAIFRIPFEVDPSERRLTEVQLYVSEDRGVTWQKAATSAPDRRFFSFQAERDGLHCFAVRTLDLQRQLHPPTLDG